ncbi:MAG: chromate resistance protein ChrB domain-containing protein [Gemmatimonadaceae bacterium]
MSTSPDRRWLLMIHRVPPKPDYLRVKIGRRLARVGAVAVKNSVYVLPDSPSSLEDMQWIRSEIVAAGGEALISRAALVEGLTNAETEELFRRVRAAQFEEIAREAATLQRGAKSLGRKSAEQRAKHGETLARLERRLESVRALDFFLAPEGAAVSTALGAIRSSMPQAGQPRSRATMGAFRGRVWVTRRDIFVDRIASAWLIQRFIDSVARFRFVSEETHRLRDGELRFDMFEGEYTHEGDHCTFETLLARFGLRDPALAALGEVVHDIDLKDAKFAREEASGVERVIAGMCKSVRSDKQRLERGRQLFDELYQGYRDVLPPTELPLGASAKGRRSGVVRPKTKRVSARKDGRRNEK